MNRTREEFAERRVDGEEVVCVHTSTNEHDVWRASGRAERAQERGSGRHARLEAAARHGNVCDRSTGASNAKTQKRFHVAKR
jgi:hypothetical protein